MAGDIGPNLVSDFGGGEGLPVFGADGRLQGNLTGNYGQAPSSNTLDSITLPPIGGPATAAAAGVTGAATPPASTTGNVNPTAAASNWFVRGVVVILGFIFVAVGLSQFGAFGAGIGAGKWYDK